MSAGGRRAPLALGHDGTTALGGKSVSSSWKRLAGRTGGTIAGLATATTADGATIVFAATAIGLHRSSDAGRTWTPASVGSIAPFVEVVAPSPNFGRDRTIFVGTRNGLYRSLDGGATWQLMLVGSRMLAIALAPHYAKENLLFAGTETDGALRSPDAGRSWTSSNPGLLDLTVLAIALSPDFERDQTGFLATASGLYRTRNAGKSWRAVELALEEPAVQCLAVSPAFADDRLVLAGTEADGLLRSEDAGATWEVVPELAEQGVTAIAFSTRYPERPVIAAATIAGVAISTDAGATWRTTGQHLGPVLSLTFVPDGEREVLLAGLPKEGIARSEDDGATWTMANEGLSANLLVGLTLSPAFSQDQTLFAAGLEDGVTVSRDGGATWAPANAGLDDTTVFGLAASPAFATDRTLYAATAAGVYRSRDAAAAWEPVRGDQAPATVGAVLTGPAQAGRPALVLAALLGGKLIASDDGGATWRALGQPFGGAEVISLAISPGFAEDRTIFAGTSKTLPDGSATDLVLWRSTDGGVQWERWLVERGQNVLPLALSPNYPVDKLLFVGLGNRVLRPRRNIEEVRGGARRPLWQGADLDAETPLSITALAVSPNFVSDGTLFAATNAGVYVSRDGGERFSAWSEGLSPASVVALAVSPGYAGDRLVYAIGLGGTIWRRKDE
jgi:photosystem II stability/assembly factor-like uncharacterized protein